MVGIPKFITTTSFEGFGWENTSNFGSIGKQKHVRTIECLFQMLSKIDKLSDVQKQLLQNKEL